MKDERRYLGFDPGGKGNFGWCVLGFKGEELTDIKSGTCSSAVEAFAHTSEALDGREPQAVGIDAPLHWVKQGDRPVDVKVRNAVAKSSD